MAMGESSRVLMGHLIFCEQGQWLERLEAVC